jgi:enoyl-CoA hydratase/carnithine racemase
MDSQTCARINVRLESRDGGEVAFVTVDNQRKLNILGRALTREFSSRCSTMPAARCAIVPCR